MARRQILSLSERESLLALPDEELTLTRMAYFSEHDLALIRGSKRESQKIPSFRMMKIQSTPRLT